jgi:hypothetical protein
VYLLHETILNLKENFSPPFIWFHGSLNVELPLELPTYCKKRAQALGRFQYNRKYHTHTHTHTHTHSMCMHFSEYLWNNRFTYFFQTKFPVYTLKKQKNKKPPTDSEFYLGKSMFQKFCGLKSMWVSDKSTQLSKYISQSTMLHGTRRRKNNWKEVAPSL